MNSEAPERSTRMLWMAIRGEQDVVLCRNRARTLAAALNFDRQQQVRIATAVSEIVRNAFHYASDATAEFRLLGVEPELTAGLPKVSSPLCVTEVLGLAICLPFSPGPINPRAVWAWAFLVPSA